MSKSLFTFITIVCLCLASAHTHAGVKPKAGKKDARIKTYLYEDDQVYRFKGHYGFSTVIEFSPRESVDSVSMGDSKAWQVVRSEKKNILFIKPLLKNAETNMTVLTSRRIYSFELSAGNAPSHEYDNLAFRIKFDYPEDREKKKDEKEKYDPFKDRGDEDFNFSYSYAGSNRLKPIRAFDDGTFTYLRFRNFGKSPAVFAVNEKGRESLVNFTMKDDYMVISSINAQFTLRDGDTATCIFNDLLQGKDEIQKKPKPIVTSSMKHLAIPVPDEKPYFARSNKDGFFGSISTISIKSMFKGDDGYNSKSKGYNQ
ncbi:MAG: P-type conjugative transfer protein VirB9 [Alphaproteobacteria bacterium]|nr:P-type conjugative transfer protein VirB9 [Alphaproteobacteria bacterium]